jgi:hypothetical protein
MTNFKNFIFGIFHLQFFVFRRHVDVPHKIYVQICKQKIANTLKFSIKEFVSRLFFG